MRTKQIYRKKDYSILLIVYIVVIGLLLMLGTFLEENNVHLMVPTGLVLGYLLFTIIKNLVIRYKNKKKLGDYESYYNTFFEDKTEIKKNKDIYFKRYKRINIKARYYLLSIHLSIMMIILFLMTFISIWYIIILVILFGLYELYLLKATMLIPLGNNPYEKLNTEKYSTILSIIKKAINISKLDIHDKVDIFLINSSNFGVNKIDDRYNILLGIRALRILNEKELISILLHELGHIINDDVEYSKTISNNNIRWTILRELFSSKIFFRNVGYDILSTGVKFLNAISVENEEKADLFVTNLGYSDSYNAAGIKLFMLNYFEVYKFSENLFEKFENMPENLLEEIHNSFINAYEKKKDEWIKYISSELEYENNTHPILSKRIYNQNINEIVIDFNNQEEYIKAEIENLFLEKNCWFNEQRWKEDRNYFLYNKEMLEKYEENPTTTTFPLYNIAVGYFNICKIDLALELFDKVLEQYPLYADALYYKGIILLEQNNMEGLKCLELSVEYNHQIFNDALIEIMNYCVFHGLTEQFEYYKSWVKQKMNVELEIEKAAVNKKGKFISSNFTFAQKELIKTKLFKLNVKECYVVAYKYSKKYKENCLFLKIKSYKDEKERYFEQLAIMNAINEIIQNVKIFPYINPKVYRIKDSRVLSGKEYKKYVDYKTVAANPGNLIISNSKFNYIVNTLYNVDSIYLGSNKRKLTSYIACGDTQPAVVVSIDPLLIAVYSDEMDAVVVLKFHKRFKEIYDLKVGSRLISVNVYTKGTKVAQGIEVGPNYLGRWIDFTCNIADFLSDDLAFIELKKLKIAESHWQYVETLGQKYILKNSRYFRKGFWFTTSEKNVL